MNRYYRALFDSFLSYYAFKALKWFYFQIEPCRFTHLKQIFEFSLVVRHIGTIVCYKRLSRYVLDISISFV